MATIDIQGASLIVNIEGFDVVLSLRSTLTVPLTHVRNVTARPDISKLMYMEVGTRFWGVQNAGTMLMGTVILPRDEGYVFCDVRDASKAIQIELQHDKYRKIIVELSNESPELAKARIEAALTPSG